MPVRLESITPKKRIIDAQKTVRGVRQGMRQYLEQVAEEMSEYPGPKPGSKYVRLGDTVDHLQWGWKSGKILKISPDGSVGSVENPVIYAAYVQGPKDFRAGGTGAKQQAQHRKTGWKSITDVARSTAPRYKQIMNRAITGTGREGV